LRDSQGSGFFNPSDLPRPLRVLQSSAVRAHLLPEATEKGTPATFASLLTVVRTGDAALLHVTGHAGANCWVQVMRLNPVSLFAGVFLVLLFASSMTGCYRGDAAAPGTDLPGNRQASGL